MLGTYTWLMREELRWESAKRTFQKLQEDNTYSYKALKAYITLDDTFGKTTDKRKLRWAKRYLRTHNVKFQDIKAILDAAWEEDYKLYNEIGKAFNQACPGLSAFLGSYL